MLRQSCTWQSEELKRFVPLVWLWNFVAMDTRPGVTSCSYSTLSEAVNRRTFFSCATSDPAPVCLIAAPVPIDGQSHFPIDPLLASRARQEFDSSLIDQLSLRTGHMAPGQNISLFSRDWQNRLTECDFKPSEAEVALVSFSGSDFMIKTIFQRMTEDGHQKMGLTGATSYVIGNIIGSGIFITPASILRYTNSVGLSLIIWTACSVIAILG